MVDADNEFSQEDLNLLLGGESEEEDETPTKDAPGIPPLALTNFQSVPLKVAEKIQKASAKLKNIPASGYDGSTQSRYATHSDILQACDPILDEVGLAIIFVGHEVISERETGKNARGIPSIEILLRSYYDVIDLESGERYRAVIIGAGRSFGGKALLIASTMATNYAYRLILRFDYGPEDKKTAVKGAGRPPVPAPAGVRKVTGADVP